MTSMEESVGSNPGQLVAYSLTASQLDDSLLGVIVLLPPARYHEVVEGELVGVSRTGSSFMVRVLADGRVGRYRLEPGDAVHIYGPLLEVSARA
jgi:hypothetical protein